MSRAAGLRTWALCLGLAAPIARAQDTTESAAVDDATGWLESQVRRFRSYPHLDRAYRLINRGTLVEAEKELEIFLDIAPADLKARLAYADVLYRTGDYAGTVEQAEKALQRSPALSAAFPYRGLARLALEETEAAVDDFRAVAGLAGAAVDDRAYAVGALSDIVIRQGRFSEALDALEWMPPSERDSSFFRRRGVCLEALDRLEEAESAYNQSLNLTTAPEERLRCYRALGELAGRRQDWTGARRAYVSALELDPDDTDSMRALGELFYRQGDTAHAVEWLLEVLAADPNPKDRRFLVNLYLSREDYPGAIHQLEILRGEARSPADRHRVFVTLGHAYAAWNKYEEAARAFRTALEYEREPAAYLALAETEVQLGHPADAAQWLEEALGVAPSAEIHQKLGVLYADLGDRERALGHLHRALEADLPTELRPELLRQQGSIYYALGRYEASEKALEEALASSPEDPGLKRSLALAYTETGRLEEAASLYEELLAAEGRDSPDAQELLSRLGHLEMQRRRFEDAAELFAEASETAGTPTASLLAHWAEALSSAGEWDGAIRINHRLMATTDLTSAQRADALERLGYAYSARGTDEEAAFYLERAIEAGRNTPSLRQNLGLVLYRSGRWEKALEQFLGVLDEQKTGRGLVYVGRRFERLNRPGLALHYLRQAVAEVERFPLDERIVLLNELGLLYAGESEYARAAESWARSLELRDDPTVRLQLGRTLRLQERIEDARQILESIEPDSLPEEMEARRQDELAALYARLDLPDEAIEAARTALAVSSSAARFYALGLLYREQDRLEDAARAFESAASRDPLGSRYAEALGYTLDATGRTDEAIVRFESVLARDPEYLRLYEQLGYLHMKQPNNDAAERWFMSAIDNEPFYPVHTQAEKEELGKDIFRFRREVTKITNHFDFTLYTSLRSDTGAPPPAAIGSAVLASQGGVELAYQPHGWGFRNERVFQVFARMLWNHEPESLRWETDSFQGGLGVRYKPLKSHNLHGSLERLFRIGEDSQNNWLVRGLYSWDYGYELQPGRDSWNYTLLYGEVGYLLQDPRTLVFYAEGREGWTFNVSESLLLTPHLILDGRHQDPATSISNYVEAGPGVSFKVLFNENRFKAPRSALELALQYRWGRFLGGLREEDVGFGGWVVGASIHF